MVRLGRGYFLSTCSDTYVCADSGTYTFTYDIIDIADNVISTADVTYTVLFTVNEMARDDDAVIGTLGIGAGNGGYLGQTFQISVLTTSKDVFYTGNGTFVSNTF